MEPGPFGQGKPAQEPGPVFLAQFSWSVFLVSFPGQFSWPVFLPQKPVKPKCSYILSDILVGLSDLDKGSLHKSSVRRLYRVGSNRCFSPMFKTVFGDMPK